MSRRTKLSRYVAHIKYEANIKIDVEYVGRDDSFTELVKNWVRFRTLIMAVINFQI
jgi:hypothetical protein